MNHFVEAASAELSTLSNGFAACNLVLFEVSFMKIAQCRI